MDRKYNAFISYRHAPEDIKIASEIQTQLERFKIPAEIQKKTGVRRFERVFRDKEELPITSNLNDDIDLALRNSDHLIVICSVRTGESIWVMKEIETFLKYHTKKEIFTVLVDGEPEDVIPDILRRDTVTRKFAGGIEETREEIIEPLSCDYRIGIKKARKTELPRLAASMLGVAYDELIQRRKQYIRRRIAVIASAGAVIASCAIGYLIWSMFQIQKNYDLAMFNYQLAQENYDMAQANYLTAEQNYQESLKNQSRYLASESRELLAAHDRLGAVQLALAALPSEGNDRPVTSEAEFALAEALGAYTTPGLLETGPVWKYGTGYNIRKFRVDPDNCRIAIHDNQRNLIIWSTVDHSQIASFKEDGHNLNDFILGENGKLFLCYSDELRVYDNDLETILWSLPLSGKQSSYTDDNMMRALFDTSDLLYASSDAVMLIDLETGKVNEEHIVEDELVLPDGSKPGDITIMESRISYDGSMVAIECLLDYTDRAIYIYDRNDGVWTFMGDGFKSVSDFKFSEDMEKLIVTYERDNFFSSYAISNFQVLSESVRSNTAYDVHTGEVVWNVDVPHTLVGYGTDIQFVNYGTGDDAVRVAAILFSNKCLIVDPETGEVLEIKEMVSEYIDSYIPSAENSLVIILRNGLYLNMDLKEPGTAMTARGYFADNVDDTLVYWMEGEGNRFLIEYYGSGYITEYSTKFSDRDYVPVPESGTESLEKYIATDDHLFVLADDMTMYCYDTVNCRMEWSVKVPGDAAYNVQFICNDEEGNAYFQNINEVSPSEPRGAKIYKVSLESGEISCVLVADTSSAISTDSRAGKIYYPFYDYDTAHGYIGVIDLATGDAGKIDLVGDVPNDLRLYDIYVSPDGKYAILPKTGSGTPAIYGADLETGVTNKFEGEEESFAAWSPDSSKYVISTIYEAVVYNINGGEIFRVASSESRILDVYLCEMGLIVVQGNGIASLYDYEGELITVLDVLMGDSVSQYSNHLNVDFGVTGDTMILYIDGTSVVVDMKDFKAKARMEGLLSYDPDSGNCYLAVPFPSETIGSFGYFHIKSVDDLIAEGNEFVGSEVMSFEMKRKYGIE